MLVLRGLVRRHIRHEAEERAKSAFDLLRDPGLRRTLIMSGVTLTGIELFSFYLPIYGRSIGLAPPSIGMVLSSYAVAGFIVRSFMHRLARATPRSACSPASLFVAALAYLLVPLAARGAAARRGRVHAGARARLGAAAHHHPHLQPCARRALGRGARHAHHGEQGDPDRRCRSLFGGLGAALGSVPVFLATGVFLLAAGLISLRTAKGEANEAALGSVRDCSSRATPRVGATPRARRSAASKVYQEKWCHSCHGTAGQGGERGAGPKHRAQSVSVRGVRDADAPAAREHAALPGRGAERPGAGRHLRLRRLDQAAARGEGSSACCAT